MGIGTVTIKVIKSKDIELIEKFKAAIDLINFRIINTNINFLGHSISGANGFDDATLKEICSLDSELITNMTLDISPPSINKSFQLVFNRTADQTGIDNITINPHQLTTDEYLVIFAKIVSHLRRELLAFDSKGSFQEISKSAEGRALDLLNADLKELRSISISIVRDQEKWRQELEGKYDKRKEELQSDYDDKNDELIAKETDLADKLKTIDDRSSIHARRMIREKLIDAIKNRYSSFKLSQDTIDLRSPVSKLLIFLIFFFAIAFILSLLVSFGLIGQNSGTIEFGIKQLFLGLAFASTIVFYFRWHKSWFDRHANEEFQLKKLELDFERASWLVEIVSEWAENNKGQFPEALLGRLSDRLFEPVVVLDNKDDSHPADQLASTLFGASSKLNLNLGNGNTLEVDRKGINKIGVQ